MANPHHLDILKQGVNAWNQWRMENIFTEPDLTDAVLMQADLFQAYLAGVNFHGANLNQARLIKAHLMGADLSNTDLCDARLNAANLEQANLTEAQAIGADLSGANLTKSDLSKANFSNAYFTEANLRRAKLRGTNLTNAILRSANLDTAILFEADVNGADFYMARLLKAYLNSAINLAKADFAQSFLNHVDLGYARLEGAKFSGARLRGANLSYAHLSQADLRQADFFHAKLNGADLRGANLMGANLLETDLRDARLEGAKVYGISAWNIKLEGAIQSDLIITPEAESTITVDELEVAQFIYLLLKNEKISKVINTIGKKGVLILGRFTDPERKAVLEAMRAELRSKQYVPIVFDFERPTERDFTETIMTLAGMCLFIIADITNPKSTPLELQATVPDYMIPFVPIIQADEEPFAMFRNLQKFPWVLPLVKYRNREILLDVFQLGVIDPALKKRNDLIAEKAGQLISVDAEELLKKHRESI
ncbi:MAG TPA: pentapeptide repeat-containing protein [Pyrinomonadaceae bacterium]|nr:pentapeptide repeat-containing protein [Pyrinomonadaceae bacterium]